MSRMTCDRGHENCQLPHICAVLARAQPSTTPDAPQTCEVLPCPFCGGVADVVSDLYDREWAAECRTCSCYQIATTRDAAVAAWNRRTAIAAPTSITPEQPNAVLSDTELAEIRATAIYGELVEAAEEGERIRAGGYGRITLLLRRAAGEINQLAQHVATLQHQLDSRGG